MCHDLYFLYPRCGHLVSINGIEHLCTEYPDTGEICKVGNNGEKYLPGRVAMNWEWLLESEDDLDYVSGREHPNRTMEYSAQRVGPGFCTACKKGQSTPLTESEIQDMTGGELEGWNRHKRWLKVKEAQDWQWETLKRQGKGGTKGAVDTTTRKKQLSPVQEDSGPEKGGKSKGEQVEGRQEKRGQAKGKGKKIEDMTEEAMMEMAMAASLVEQ